MINEIPSSTETYLGCEQSEPYDPSRFGGLRREDWNYPTGCLWKDKRLAVGLIDDDQERLNYNAPYQFLCMDNDQFVLSSHLISLRCLWFELMTVLGRGDQLSDRTASDHIGFKVSTQDGLVRISRTEPRHIGDCFRTDHIETLEMSVPYAESLLKCVEVALRHGSAHYWRMVERRYFSKSSPDRVIAGSDPDFLPCALRGPGFKVPSGRPIRAKARAKRQPPNAEQPNV